jgi:hypothetical protein
MSGLVQSASGVIGFFAGVTALFISGMNAWYYPEDRQNKARQESFDNQIGIAKVYFGMVDEGFCNNQQEATLLVKIVEHAASRSQGSSDDGLANLARLMEANFQAHSCSGDALVGNAAPEDQGVATVQEAQPNSTYGFKEQVAVNASRTGQNPSYRVFIQYRSPGALQRARQLQTEVDRDARYVAPGLDAVDQVPSQDEIRIYKLTDQPVATDLRNRFLPGARIVNLEKAYPNLPARTLEVWLKE